MNDRQFTLRKYKVNSKWIKELIIGTKSIRLLKENIWETFHIPSLGNDSLDMISKP